MSPMTPGDDATRRAELLIDAGRAEAAVALLSGRTDLAGDARAHLALSRAYGQLDRHRESLTAAETATRIDPDSVLAWLLVALARRRLRRLPEALDAAERALRLDPVGANSHRVMADVLGQLGQFGKAEHHVDQAVAREPAVALSWLARCRLELARKRWPEAEGAARHALTLDPESDQATLLLGLAQANTGHLPKQVEAIETLHWSLRNNPDQPEARRILLELARPSGLQLPISPVLKALLILAGGGGVLLVLWAGEVTVRWWRTPREVKRLVWSDRGARIRLVAGLVAAAAVAGGLVVVVVYLTVTSWCPLGQCRQPTGPSTMTSTRVTTDGDGSQRIIVVDENGEVVNEIDLEELVPPDDLPGIDVDDLLEQSRR